MKGVIAWNCDFCGKNGITISAAGILYCPICGISYGETIHEGILKALKEFRKKNWRHDLPRNEAYEEYLKIYTEDEYGFKHGRTERDPPDEGEI